LSTSSRELRGGEGNQKHAEQGLSTKQTAGDVAEKDEQPEEVIRKPGEGTNGEVIGQESRARKARYHPKGIGNQTGEKKESKKVEAIKEAQGGQNVSIPKSQKRV